MEKSLDEALAELALLHGTDHAAWLAHKDSSTIASLHSCAPSMVPRHRSSSSAADQ